MILYIHCINSVSIPMYEYHKIMCCNDSSYQWNPFWINQFLISSVLNSLYPFHFLSLIINPSLWLILNAYLLSSVGLIIFINVLILCFLVIIIQFWLHLFFLLFLLYFHDAFCAIITFHPSFLYVFNINFVPYQINSSNWKLVKMYLFNC